MYATKVESKKALLNTLISSAFKFMGLGLGVFLITLFSMEYIESFLETNNYDISIIESVLIGFGVIILILNAFKPDKFLIALFSILAGFNTAIVIISFDISIYPLSSALLGILYYSFAWVYVKFSLHLERIGNIFHDYTFILDNILLLVLSIGIYASLNGNTQLLLTKEFLTFVVFMIYVVRDIVSVIRGTDTLAEGVINMMINFSLNTGFKLVFLIFKFYRDRNCSNSNFNKALLLQTEKYELEVLEKMRDRLENNNLNN